MPTSPSAPWTASNRQLLRSMQRHVAFAAVGPTTLRNMLPKGQRPILCEWLAELQLGGLQPDSFCGTLNKWTDGLVEAASAPWGAARKALNLFLRDATYNYILREAFQLEAIERYLEVPLDGIVMKKLYTDPGELPTPPSVIRLTKDTSAKFQAAAMKLAKRKDIDRVHLDINLWSGGI